MSLNQKIDEIITILKSAGEVYTDIVEEGINKLEELKQYKPKVKELEWISTSNHTCLTYTVIGNFYVYVNREQTKFRYWYSYDGIGFCYYESIDEAKSAAQEHFNNLVLGCLNHEIY